MKENKSTKRKDYLKPSSSYIHINEDSRLLASSPNTGFNPSVIPPKDEDGGEDDNING
ncbi:MAG: hypothetical protein ACTTJN_01215 [Prevotella intermedia]|uniref:hypothetical protein n=1 Tax=Prevotella intermedia TaxID=28131 RepID=UPI0015CF15EE|nr:hypothetical protein [Prevotella intermedia]